MIVFARIVLLFVADLIGVALLALRPRRSVEAENLVLRRQLALYKERGVKPRRIDVATRVSLCLAVQAVRLAILSDRRSPRNRDSQALGPVNRRIRLGEMLGFYRYAAA